MNTYIVVINVSKHNYRYSQVVAAIRASSEEEAIASASEGWMWEEEDEKENYEVEKSATLLSGEKKQFIFHE